MLLWIVLRACRLLAADKVRRDHGGSLKVTRFVRNLTAILLPMLVICFMIAELGELSAQNDLLENPTLSTDADWLVLAMSHVLKAVLYAALMMAGIMLLFYGGSATDYNIWLTTREVAWNAACGATVSAYGIVHRSLLVNQLVGLPLFMVAWLSYWLMRALRAMQRMREEHSQGIQNVDFSTIKEAGREGDPSPLSDEVIVRTQELGDSASDDEIPLTVRRRVPAPSQVEEDNENDNVLHELIKTNAIKDENT